VNVGSVLFLFFFIFAVMGMNLFGFIKMQEFIHRQANFRNFPAALILLFRMATGESWNGLMHDCMITQMCVLVLKSGARKLANAAGVSLGAYLAGLEEAGEVEMAGDASFYVMNMDSDFLKGLVELDDFENQCSPHPSAAIIYFSVFIILCAFVMLNLVIAVILDNFQNSNDSDAPVGREQLTLFCEQWSKLDPHATYYISAAELQVMVASLDPPMGTKGSGTGKSEIQSIIMSVDIPNHNGKIHFLETLHALAGRIVGTGLPEDEEVKIRGKIADRLPVVSTGWPKYTAAHYHAALYVQAAVRGYLARYQMRAKLAEAEPVKVVESDEAPQTM